MSATKTLKKPLPYGYKLVESPPPLEDYLNIRKTAGLTPKTPEQSFKALAGAWYTVHLTYGASENESPKVVGMGRIIGDGGWYFHIVDMAVLPDHQRKGLGDQILGNLLDTIVRDAPETPYVNLIADPPGKKLYARHGFVETAGTKTGSVGMEWRS